jgi:hypothetical protein
MLVLMATGAPDRLLGTAHPAPDDDLTDLLRQFRHLPPVARAEVERLIGDNDPSQARDHFLPFVRRAWPEFIYGGHHKIIGGGLRAVARGELKRVIINLPPRRTISKIASVLEIEQS